MLKGWPKDVEHYDAMIMWTKALADFRQDPASATPTLAAAAELNAFIPEFLFKKKWVDTHSTSGYERGKQSEANEYAKLSLDAWSMQAIEWVDVTLAALGMNQAASDPKHTFYSHS